MIVEVMLTSMGRILDRPALGGERIALVAAQGHCRYVGIVLFGRDAAKDSKCRCH